MLGWHHITGAGDNSFVPKIQHHPVLLLNYQRKTWVLYLF